MRAAVGEKDDMIEVGGRCWWRRWGSLDVVVLGFASPSPNLKFVRPTGRSNFLSIHLTQAYEMENYTRNLYGPK